MVLYTIKNMKEYLTYGIDKRMEIIQKIRRDLTEKNHIIFAYVFGSFLDAPSFRDIDIGIYITGIKEDDVFACELELAEKISGACNVPFDIIDVKVLNFVPRHFLNNIFCNGTLLFCRNQQLLSEMIENTSLDTIANENIACQSLKELVPA